MLTRACLTAPVIRAQLGILATLAADAATIQPGAGGQRPGFGGECGALSGTFTLARLIRLAYSVQDFQISGGPGWLYMAEFHLEVKGGCPFADQDFHSLTREILSRRFRLKFHREWKPGTDQTTVQMLVIDQAEWPMAD